MKTAIDLLFCFVGFLVVVHVGTFIWDEVSFWWKARRLKRKKWFRKM